MFSRTRQGRKKRACMTEDRWRTEYTSFLGLFFFFFFLKKERPKREASIKAALIYEVLW